MHLSEFVLGKDGRQYFILCTQRPFYIGSLHCFRTKDGLDDYLARKMKDIDTMTVLGYLMAVTVEEYGLAGRVNPGDLSGIASVMSHWYKECIIAKRPKDFQKWVDHSYNPVLVSTRFRR